MRPPLGLRIYRDGDGGADLCLDAIAIAKMVGARVLVLFHRAVTLGRYEHHEPAFGAALPAALRSDVALRGGGCQGV